MADEDLRELERMAAQGDRHAQAQLVRARVRQGALPRNTFLLTPRERVDAWIRANGVDGIEVSEGRIDETRHGAMAKDIAGAIRLRWWTPYEHADQIRLVVANMTEMLEWADPSRIAIQPVARLQHFEVVLQLYLFDPLRMFKSRSCVEALAGDDPTHQHLSDLVRRARIAATDSMSDGDRDRFVRGLQEFLFTGFSSAGRDEAERFEAELSGDLEHLVRDLRLVADLGRSHRGLIKTIDEWVHRERFDASGAVVGKDWYLPVWTTYRSSYGVNTLPELRDETCESPARPQAADLYAKLADEALTDRERRDACSLLMDLSREEGGIFQIRALGWLGYSDVVLHRAVSFPELAPLFETLAMTHSNDRLDHALQQLRDLGEAFDDPLEAWERAPGVRGLSFTSFHQDTILHSLPRTHPALVPLLIAELQQVADAMPTGAIGVAWQGLRRLAGGGGRTSDWIQAALQGLRNAAAREAGPVALRLTSHADEDVRGAALSFFRGCDDAQALPILLAALDDDALDVVAAAEHGLSGQTTMSVDVLYDALERLEDRSAAASEDDRFTAQQLGSQLLRILERFGVPEDPERVQRVQRTAARTSWLSEEARRFVALVAHETTEPTEPADRSVGATPVETFNLRYSVWRQPGYVRSCYGDGGHRDPAWDAWVEQAHAHYDSEQNQLAGPLLQRAIDAGCRDGMVLYRRAITVTQDTERALELLREAAARLPEQYPFSPYAVSAWEGIGNILSGAGRDEEALEAYRLASGEMCPPKVTAAYEKLQAKVELRRVSADGLRPLATGGLKPWPSVWHLAPVTAVALSPDGARMASADEAGWVQVSLVDRDSIVPVRGAEVHSPGRIALAWRDANTLLSAGADGRLCVLDEDREAPHLRVREALRHDAPLTAIAPLGANGALLGDTSGAVLLAEGTEAQPLDREGRADSPIRVILTSERWWAVHDQAGRLEVWNAGGPSAYVGNQALTFVTFEEEGALAVGLGGGNGVRVALPSGRHLGPFALPRAGQPLYVTHAAGLGSVFAWPRGPIQVTAGQGLTYLIKEPLAVVHAEVSQQVGCFAEATGKLGMFRWRP